MSNELLPFAFIYVLLSTIVITSFSLSFLVKKEAKSFFMFLGGIFTILWLLASFGMINQICDHCLVKANG